MLQVHRNNSISHNTQLVQVKYGHAKIITHNSKYLITVMKMEICEYVIEGTSIINAIQGKQYIRLKIYCQQFFAPHQVCVYNKKNCSMMSCV